VLEARCSCYVCAPAAYRLVLAVCGWMHACCAPAWLVRTSPLSTFLFAQAASSGAFDPDEAAEFIVCSLDLIRWVGILPLTPPPPPSFDPCA
jgi:hypothetical protein